MKWMSHCPTCQQELQITRLTCPDCGLSIDSIFSLSRFELLSGEELEFLETFLRARGSLKEVQERMGQSYPAVRRRLNELILHLGLGEEKPIRYSEEVQIKMEQGKKSPVPSERIRALLLQEGGSAVVTSLNGTAYRIQLSQDQEHFFCDALPVKPGYELIVFDLVVELLQEKGGRARKGMGRNARLGERGCELDTVVGTIGARYAGAQPGESVLDPVFVLAAVLEWAGICRNERGWLSLTVDYWEETHSKF